MGAMMTEALAAADRLEQAGLPPTSSVSPAPACCSTRCRPAQGRTTADTWILEQLFPADRATSLVTVLDGHPHTLSFLAGINRVPSIALGVTKFGQVGGLEDVYRYHGIDTDSIVRAALDVCG